MSWQKSNFFPSILIPSNDHLNLLISIEYMDRAPQIFQNSLFSTTTDSYSSNRLYYNIKATNNRYIKLSYLVGLDIETWRPVG